MKLRTRLRKYNRNGIYRALLTIVSIAINVLLSFAAFKLGIPLYFDTVGTIFCASLCGLFPGIVTAVVTSVLCGSFNTYSIYYVLIAILVAISAAYFTRKSLYRKKINILLFILELSLLGGGLGTVFQFILLGRPQFDEIADAAALLTGGSGIDFFALSMAMNIGINIVDKGLSVIFGVIMIYLIPEEKRSGINNSAWRQKPLTDTEKKDIDRSAKNEEESLKRRITMMLIISTLSIALAVMYISVNLYWENTEADYTQNAQSAAKLAASVIDPQIISDAIMDGRKAKGYIETEQKLYDIRGSIVGLKYLYVIKVEDEGCRFIFDLKGEDEGDEAYEVGQLVPFEDGFEEEEMELKHGGMIEPAESNEKADGWLVTAYYPIYNSEGYTVAYVGADVSLDYLSGYMSEYILKVVLVFSGFFILILGYGLWVSGMHLLYPIGSIAHNVEGFMEDITDQEALDANVRALRKLDIHTGDEVERLYRAMCEMASGTAEQMREIRHFTETTAKMQTGLIITMADMVEDRDSDTGAHVQKTAEYVRIIANGLKEKGYYTEKLTPDYMTAVVMSAPLHDVGKINIPDAILNKPGKLNDDEYAIMKTHTTAGKNIIEKAISKVNGESYLKEARNMAAYHHERWDGRGYPERLHGQVIPLSARIMAVADVFDALTSRRVYKPPFPLEKAIEILQDGAGTQFDPKCVEVFIDALPEVKKVLRKYQEA